MSLPAGVSFVPRDWEPTEYFPSVIPVSPFAPASTFRVWLDTSTVPAIFKAWDGSGWVSVIASGESDAGVASAITSGTQTRSSLATYGDARWQRDLGILNVKDYGAIGDGTTDDTTAIQDALTAAGSIGVKTVALGSGTFVVSGVTIPSGVTLDGRGGVIKHKAASTAPAVSIPADSVRATIIDVEVDGNTAAQTSNVLGVEVTGNLARVERCYVHDVKWDGIVIVAPSDGTVVTDCRVKTTGRYGITLNSGDGVTPVTHCVVHGNSVEASTNGALGIVGVGAFVTFSSNTTKASGGDGIAAYNGLNRHVACIGNTIESPANHGIHLGGDGLVMSGNAVYNVTNGHGLFAMNSGATDLTNASDVVSITGNTIHSVTPGAGIRVEFAHVATVTGNSLTTLANQGVFLKDVIGSTVGSNAINATAGHGIELLRARRVAISGNVVESVGGTGKSAVYGADGAIPADACTLVTITGNTVNGTSGIAVRSVENSDRWLVDANVLQGWSGSAVSLLGANNSTGTNLTT